MQIFCDMDGVLVDLHPSMAAAAGIKDPDYSKWNFYIDEMGPLTFNRILQDLPAAWWATLPVYEHTHRLIEYLTSLSDVPVLLTHAVSAEAEEGKKAWNKFHGSPFACICVSCPTEKADHAQPDRILIDDKTENVSFWNSAGGFGILWDQPWNQHAIGLNRVGSVKELENVISTFFPESREPEAVRLPTDAQARKDTPVASGFLNYFPLAIAEVARLSKVGNDQHNPGKPLHWDRSKSGDESDALARHLLQAGTFDTDGQRHSTKVAWRAMAMLQKELEEDVK